MNITNLNKLKPKKLIVFDLDGTLAPTKSVIDSEMNRLMVQLLGSKKVAVIGGGKLELFKEQFLNELKAPKEEYKHLFLFPTTATTFLRHNGKSWQKVYSHLLTKEQVKRIQKAFAFALKQINYVPPKKTYGKILENRGTQMTFSFLGQDVVKILGKKGVKLKDDWRDHNTPLKLKVAKLVAKQLPDLEVRAAGHTSIDVTKKGIDKAYGLRQIQKYLGVPIKEMLFVGDAIFPGGNDYAIVKTKVDYCKVKDPEETKKIIKYILSKK